MATQLDGAAVTEMTCGICLEDSKNPLNLPCGHSFCDGCLGEWRSRYGVKEEMRRKCPTCRARIPPSKEMVAEVLGYRANKQKFEDKNDTSSEIYFSACRALEQAEQQVGADWDGVTVLEDNRKPAVVMPDYIYKAVQRGDIKSVLKWINANRGEDRVNAISSTELMSTPVLSIASVNDYLTMMTLLLQLGADVNFRESSGVTAMYFVFNDSVMAEGVRLLLSWGANFFPIRGDKARGSREDCICLAREKGQHELANLLKSELGGRRCAIVNISSRPQLNGKTCVAEEYMPDGNQYKVSLETKDKEVVVLGPDNLKRRDRTPNDCGYYIELKNGRTIRHDFDSSEDCQAFVAALNSRDGKQPLVTEKTEARAEQAAAELLAELGLDDSAIESSSCCKAKKSKKKKGGKKKKK